MQLSLAPDQEVKTHSCEKLCWILLQLHLIAKTYTDSNLYKTLKDQLESDFPGQLEFSYEATRSQTGWLEVSLEDGTILHSKKNGDGYITEAKYDKIASGITKALAK
ncbi:Hypothetical predicted protein [Octopus vulgaris]|uniref:Selenoprotein W n=1 Tax=Octopus vulgaris TaxID=6645 RepID=A0AA36BI56_OCTVU|nr:Hypothetical predicted protein [Octopus vulgaris]